MSSTLETFNVFEADRLAPERFVGDVTRAKTSTPLAPGLGTRLSISVTLRLGPVLELKRLRM